MVQSVHFCLNKKLEYELGCNGMVPLIFIPVDYDQISTNSLIRILQYRFVSLTCYDSLVIHEQKTIADAVDSHTHVQFHPASAGEEGAQIAGGMWTGFAGLEEEAESLDAKLLPYTAGRISFGIGIQLKMAVARWAEWAADVGLHDDKRGTLEGCGPPWGYCG